MTTNSMRLNLRCVVMLNWLMLMFSLFIAQTYSSSSQQPILIIVDPFTEYLSGHLKNYCKANSPPIRVVELASHYTAGALEARGMQIPQSFRVPDDLEAWADAENISLDPSDTLVVSESDCGTLDAERIASTLGLVGNGNSPQLRNKYLANERLREKGIPSVKQVWASCWEEAEDFLDNVLWTEGTDTQCVIKPYRGVASDGVHLCNSLEGARRAFDKLYMKPQFGGGTNERVLVQEYVTGTEYAVDTIARDGEIKVVALWRYRKLPFNGAPFVYQCSELVSADGEYEASVCDYCVDVLKGLGLKWGPTHTEIMCTASGPRLIEVNAGRFHAQHFYPIVRGCLGYDALAGTLDSFFNPAAFDMIPDRPDSLLAHGLILHLINSRQGTVRALHHEEEIRALPSVLSLHLEAGVGDPIARTVDIRTDSGYVLLQHADDAVVQADFNRIVKLQHTIFEVQDDGTASAGAGVGAGAGAGAGPAVGAGPTAEDVSRSFDMDESSDEGFFEKLSAKVNLDAAAAMGAKVAAVAGPLAQRISASPLGAKLGRIVIRVPVLAACYLAVAYSIGLILPSLNI